MNQVRNDKSAESLQTNAKLALACSRRTFAGCKNEAPSLAKPVSVSRLSLRESSVEFGLRHLHVAKGDFVMRRGNHYTAEREF